MKISSFFCFFFEKIQQNTFFPLRKPFMPVFVFLQNVVTFDTRLAILFTQLS